MLIQSTAAYASVGLTTTWEGKNSVTSPPQKDGSSRAPLVEESRLEIYPHVATVGKAPKLDGSSRRRIAIANHPRASRARWDAPCTVSCQSSIVKRRPEQTRGQNKNVTVFPVDLAYHHTAFHKKLTMQQLSVSSSTAAVVRLAVERLPKYTPPAFPRGSGSLPLAL